VDEVIIGVARGERRCLYIEAGIAVTVFLPSIVSSFRLDDFRIGGKRRRAHLLERIRSRDLRRYRFGLKKRVFYPDIHFQ